jgi:sucrose phosphorylase
VVAQLCALIRLRNTHPAFEGRFVLHETPDSMVELEWRSGECFARLRVDLAQGTGVIDYSGDVAIQFIEIGAR